MHCGLYVYYKLYRCKSMLVGTQNKKIKKNTVWSVAGTDNISHYSATNKDEPIYTGYVHKVWMCGRGRGVYRRVRQDSFDIMPIFRFAYIYIYPAPCPTYSCLWFIVLSGCPLKISQKAIIMCVGQGGHNTEDSAQHSWTSYECIICKILVYNDTFFWAEAKACTREQERWSKAWT